MNRKDTHPKPITAMIKEIRAKKRSVTPIIADAIEALKIEHDAEFHLLCALIDAKARASSKSTFLWCVLTSFMTTIGVLLAVQYGQT